MFKKNYFYLSIVILGTSYIAIQFIFFPETVPQYFIRVIGGIFILYSIEYFLDIQKIYLNKKNNKLDRKIIQNTKLFCFECENYMPINISKKETLSCSNCGLVHK